MEINSIEDREWTIEEIIEALRQWSPDFYSDSETQWLMEKAADKLDTVRILEVII